MYKVALVWACACALTSHGAKLDLVRPGLGPGHRFQPRTKYSYEPPALPSNLYEVPAIPSGLYETPIAPPPALPSGLYETPIAPPPALPSGLYETPIAPPPAPPSGLYETPNTPPPALPSGLYETPIAPPPALPSGLYELPAASDPQPVKEPPPPTTTTTTTTTAAPAMMAGMPYDFDWGVNDVKSGNQFSQKEKSDGNVVRGEYSVLLPDGRTQVVKYFDDGGGFNVDISYV